MFEQTFKSLDDVLRKEAGCTTDLAVPAELKQSILHKAFTGELTADNSSRSALTASLAD